jgi:uncharacterized protein (DUF1330 family)
MAIDPTGQDMKAFLEAGPEEPVVMLNLLRFTDGGREGYESYLRELGPHAEAVGGSIIYYGYGADPLVAEQGQDWDAVLLVSYPSRRAFCDMVRNPDYQRGTHLRSESLVEAVLQPTTAAPSGGRST